jgi:hypothetical protein
VSRVGAGTTVDLIWKASGRSFVSFLVAAACR